MGKNESKVSEADMQALDDSAARWRSAKKKERAARDELAGVVMGLVSSGAMTEAKVAKTTGIPRMTIRKMLGKA